MTQEYGSNYLFKMLLIGNSGVGKSCLLLRFSDDVFNENYISTIGVDFKIKSITFDGTPVKLQIWDTAGQERFKTITSSYYKGAHGVMLVYDVTNRESFDAVHNWMAEVDKLAMAGISKILVGNKVDLEGTREVTYAEGAAVAKKYGIRFLESSAKNSLNVHESFQAMTKEMLKRMNKKGVAATPGRSASVTEGKKVTLSTTESTQEKKSNTKCCG